MFSGDCGRVQVRGEQQKFLLLSANACGARGPALRKNGEWRAIKGTAVCPFGHKASVLHDFLKLFPLVAPPNHSRVTSVMNTQHRKVQNISTQQHSSSFLFPKGDFLQEKEHSYWRRRTASSQHPPRFACIYILSEYWIQMGNGPKNEVVIADHPICFLS